MTGSAEYALWGLATVTDLDNDGIADILIDGRYFFHVLRGTGGGHFAYQNDAWGNITHLAEASVDSGFAFGDIDGDGDLDLIGFTAGDPNRQIALYRNDLPAQHWLNVRPVGLAREQGRRELEDPRLRAEHRPSALVRRGRWSSPSRRSRTTTPSTRSSGTTASGARTTVDVTVTFYPSGTVVRKNGVAADSTIIIGEDGTNGIVEPPAPATPADAGAPDAGASEGGQAGSGGIVEAGTGEPSKSDSGPEAPANGGSPSSGGCGCRVLAGTSEGEGAGAVACAMLALSFVRRRRTRSTRPMAPEAR